MKAQLVSTKYDIAQQCVSCSIALTVQDHSFNAPDLMFSETALVDAATFDGRTDWNTDDCRALASAELGISVK